MLRVLGLRRAVHIAMPVSRKASESAGRGRVHIGARRFPPAHAASWACVARRRLVSSPYATAQVITHGRLLCTRSRGFLCRARRGSAATHRLLPLLLLLLLLLLLHLLHREPLCHHLLILLIPLLLLLLSDHHLLLLHLQLVFRLLLLEHLLLPHRRFLLLLPHLLMEMHLVLTLLLLLGASVIVITGFSLRQPVEEVAALGPGIASLRGRRLVGLGPRAVIRENPAIAVPTGACNVLWHGSHCLCARALRSICFRTLPLDANASTFGKTEHVDKIGRSRSRDSLYMYR